jgi:hypothetical protein
LTRNQFGERRNSDIVLSNSSRDNAASSSGISAFRRFLFARSERRVLSVVASDKSDAATTEATRFCAAAGCVTINPKVETVRARKRCFFMFQEWLSYTQRSIGRMA